MTIASNLNNTRKPTAQFSGISKIKSVLWKFAFDGINLNENFMISSISTISTSFFLCHGLMSLVKHHRPWTAIYWTICIIYSIKSFFLLWGLGGFAWHQNSDAQEIASIFLFLTNIDTTNWNNVRWKYCLHFGLTAAQSCEHSFFRHFSLNSNFEKLSLKLWKHHVYNLTKEDLIKKN